MVDSTNPATQFHSYQAPDVTPVSERQAKWGKLGQILHKAGLSNTMVDKVEGSMRDLDLETKVTKAREYARTHPGQVLGGLAAAVIGAGLLSRR